jgi:hypothetical protein
LNNRSFLQLRLLLLLLLVLLDFSPHLFEVFLADSSEVDIEVDVFEVVLAEGLQIVLLADVDFGDLLSLIHSINIYIGFVLF